MLASLVAQTVQNLPAMQESWVLSLEQDEGSLEDGMTLPPPGILAWRTPRTDEPGGATVHGVAKRRTRLNDRHVYFHCTNMADSHRCVSS